MAARSFDDLTRRGSSIATANITEREFAGIIEHVNDWTGLNVEPRGEVYALLRERLPFVAGKYWGEVQRVQRQPVLERALADALRTVTGQLSPLHGGMQLGEDTEVLNLLRDAVDEAHKGRHPHPREVLETSLKIVEGLETYCERALVRVALAPAKRGRKANEWYDEFVILMSEVARRLGVKVTTAGNWNRDPHSTPFTVLVFETEKFLPEGARSPSEEACGKRIDESRKRLRSGRGNSRRTSGISS
jgi:hypothetical protein